MKRYFLLGKLPKSDCPVLLDPIQAKLLKISPSGQLLELAITKKELMFLAVVQTLNFYELFVLAKRIRLRLYLLQSWGYATPEGAVQLICAGIRSFTEDLFIKYNKDICSFFRYTGTRKSVFSPNDPSHVFLEGYKETKWARDKKESPFEEEIELIQGPLGIALDYFNTESS